MRGNSSRLISSIVKAIREKTVAVGMMLIDNPKVNRPTTLPNTAIDQVFRLMAKIPPINVKNVKIISIVISKLREAEKVL